MNKCPSQNIVQRALPPPPFLWTTTTDKEARGGDSVIQVEAYEDSYIRLNGTLGFLESEQNQKLVGFAIARTRVAERDACTSREPIHSLVAKLRPLQESAVDVVTVSMLPSDTYFQRIGWDQSRGQLSFIHKVSVTAGLTEVKLDFRDFIGSFRGGQENVPSLLNLRDIAQAGVAFVRSDQGRGAERKPLILDFILTHWQWVR